MNLTDYIIFLYEYGLESEVYKFLSQITYYDSNIICDFDCNKHEFCSYSCKKNLDTFKENYNNIVKKDGLLFLKPEHKYRLKDDKTPFYIPVGI